MKKVIGFISLIWLGVNADAFGQQAEGSMLVSSAIDVVRTDVPGVIRRYQLGVEGNYFYRHNLSVSGGYEFNYGQTNHVTLGGRYYPLEPLFIRARGLIGSSSDFALGAGYTHNISYRVRLEGMSDYYLVSNVVGFRIGIAVLIN
ncbi:hypothetical protein [Lunatibacter salilacus]|uniref:hypothetical protein n=1 Tax=Lunatibacter salilacus TaxID=2483804 RepID=UPI00131DB799|nr:hypothetical protein [Lunatibacter salilacus]